MRRRVLSSGTSAAAPEADSEALDGPKPCMDCSPVGSEEAAEPSDFAAVAVGSSGLGDRSTKNINTVATARKTSKVTEKAIRTCLVFKTDS